MSNAVVSSLRASDGHELDAYIVHPGAQPKGAVVIVQEIFGLNDHIKRVADGYAADGYLAVAPAMFDRIGKNLLFSYSDIQGGRGAIAKLTEPMLLADLAAATKAASPAGKVVHIGYCWGGAIAYMAACKVAGVAGGVCYYGTRTIELSANMTPRAPVQYHFGALDKSIPPEGIAKIKAVHPSGIYHVYPSADHGFNCTERPSFNAEAAKLAKHRVLDFLAAID